MGPALFKLLQAVKAEFPTEVTLAGIITLASLEQPLKAQLPTDVTPLPITTVCISLNREYQGGRLLVLSQSVIAPEPVIVSVPASSSVQDRSFPHVPESTTARAGSLDTLSPGASSARAFTLARDRHSARHSAATVSFLNISRMVVPPRSKSKLIK